MSDLYEIRRRGVSGSFRVQASSLEESRQLAAVFFQKILSDFAWKKRIVVESAMGFEDIPEQRVEDALRNQD